MTGAGVQAKGRAAACRADCISAGERQESRGLQATAAVKEVEDIICVGRRGPRTPEICEKAMNFKTNTKKVLLLRPARAVLVFFFIMF